LAGPASALAFVVAGAIAILTALSTSERAMAMPASGGLYHVIKTGLARCSARSPGSATG
jgi:amino acid transporter